MSDVFLSYAHEDATRVDTLIRALEAEGWRVFWDHRIPTGETWRSHIGAALAEAHCVVAIWSKHSLDSSWVTEEADEGKRRGCLIPVLIDEVVPPLGFREIQAANLVGWQPGTHSPEFDQLLADIRHHLGQSGDRKPPPGPTPAPVPAPAPRSLTAPRMLAAIAAVTAIGLGAYFALRPQPTPVRSEREIPASSRRDVGTTLQPSDGGPGTRTLPPSRQDGWLIVLGSFPKGARAETQERLKRAREAGLQAHVIDTDNYRGLTPGLHAVVVGPLESQEAAAELQSRSKAVAQDAYLRRIGPQ